MYRPARPNLARKARIASVPAPVGGLNARDAYADMPPTDAVVMENMFPMPSYVMPRNGSAIWASGISGTVNTLATYSPPSGNRKMFAWAGTQIYDVTAQAAVGSAVYTGNTSDTWQCVNFGAGGGQYLVCVNGQDSMLLYNGSGWQVAGNGTGALISSGSAAGTLVTITTTTPHRLATGDAITVTGATPAAYNVSNATITVTGANTFTYTAGSAPGGAMTVVGTYTYTPSISGVSTSTFVNVNQYQGRLFFIQKNSMQVWYLPLGSVGGTANFIDLSTQTLLGGQVIAMATWTLQTSDGSTELAAFITSEGEVITFSGNDPSLATQWQRVGSFRIGRPVGYRCTAKIGSDVVVICADGLVPLSKAVLTDRTTRGIAISDKIVNLINTDVQTFAGYPGWQVILYPIGNKVIVNVPAPTATYQYVMNTLNGSWTKFTGWAANCWALMGDMLFYGTAGFVYRADYGLTDSGAAIQCKAIQAPNYCGSHEQKLFSAVRPVFVSDGPISASVQVCPDFNFVTSSALSKFISAAYTYWSPPWGSPWSAVQQVYRTWTPTTGIGYSGAVAIAFGNLGAQIQWQSSDIDYQQGGPI
jgi:hypothetical protein